MSFLALALLAVWLILGLQTAVHLCLFRALPASTGERAWPSLTIVIPARNEERSIGQTVDHVLGLDYPNFKLVVVNDGSTDGTQEKLQARAHDKRLTIIETETPPPGWLGKPHALAQGTALAEGPWLLMMDADVRMNAGTMKAAVSDCDTHGWDHLTVFPYLERVGFWEQLMMPSMAHVLFTLTPSFLLRVRRSPVAIGGGAFCLVRRDAYESIGGHHKLRNSVIDDMRLAMELKKAGYTTNLRLGMGWLDLRMYHGKQEILDGFTKNAHAIVGRRRLLGSAFLGVGFLVDFLPWLWPIWAISRSTFGASVPPVPPAWGAAFLLAALSRTLVHLRMGYAWWSIAFAPLSQLMGVSIFLRSIRMAYGDGVVRWRGRTYSTADTKF